jgi:hypothetical protein
MTTTNNKIGIRSLASRVDNLEQAVSSGIPTTTNNATSFADQLIQSTTTSLKDDLQTTLQHYESGLTALGINVNNFQMIDLVKAIPYTITYVETNGAAIASLMKKDLTSAFKLNTALTLIKQYFSQDEQFLIAWIKQEVDVLFNQGSNTLTDIIPNSKNKVSTMTKASAKKFSLSLNKKNSN